MRLEYTSVTDQKIDLYELQHQCIINAVAATKSLEDSYKALGYDKKMTKSSYLIKMNKFFKENNISKKDIKEMRKKFNVKYIKNGNKVKLKQIKSEQYNS